MFAINSNEEVIDTVYNQNLPVEKKETLNEKTLEKLLTKEVQNERLFQCCRNGDAHFIPALIEAGASFRDADENKMTPLTLSALHGHTMCARVLIAAGADIENLDDRRNTPLILCALRGWTSCASLLIMSGANVNARNIDGDTALIVSSRSSASHDVAKVLVGSKKANLDHSNKKGYTALMFAIEAANLNIIKLLIDAGAHLKKQTAIRSSNNSKVIWQWKDIAERKGILKFVTLFHLQKITGKSPLLIAALNGDLNSVQAITTMEYSIPNERSDSLATIIINFLRSFDEKKKIVSTIDIEIFKEMLRCTKWITLTLEDQCRVVELAVSIANCEILKILDDHTFSISCANLSYAVFKPDVLEFLIRKFQSEDKIQIDILLRKALECEQIICAKILLNHGAMLNIEEALRDAVYNSHVKVLEFIVNEYKHEAHSIIRSSNLLHVAVRNSAVDVIPILLDRGAEVNRELDGEYPLTLAEDRRVIDVLLSRCADANVEIASATYTYPLLKFVSMDFKTALMARYQDASAVDESVLNNETVEIVKSLLRHGGHAGLKNAAGQTALHIASERNNSADILNLLITSGVNVNETDITGRTALHVAVTNQRLENIQCLIDAGINLEIYNWNGQTAISETRDPEIVKLLLRGGADVNAITGFMGNTLLLQSLYDGKYTPEYIEVLISAGINLNHRNNDGQWALRVAALLILTLTTSDLDNFKLLVTSGADLNMSTHDSKNKTVITKLLQLLCFRIHRAKECIVFCLDHGANLSMLHPCLIHALISSGRLSLVSKFISFGLAPVHLMIQQKSNAWYEPEYTMSLSPLVTALLLNHAELAQNFTNIMYLLGSDISILSGNTHFQEYLESRRITNSLEFSKRVSLQPMSLEALSFIVISDTLGSTQDRHWKVQKLRLPQQLQDLLMFRNVAENAMKDVRRRNEFLIKHSLKHYNSDDDDDDDEVNEEEMFGQDYPEANAPFLPQ